MLGMADATLLVLPSPLSLVELKRRLLNVDVDQHEETWISNLKKRKRKSLPYTDNFKIALVSKVCTWKEFALGKVGC